MNERVYNILNEKNIMVQHSKYTLFAVDRNIPYGMKIDAKTWSNLNNGDKLLLLEEVENYGLLKPNFKIEKYDSNKPIEFHDIVEVPCTILEYHDFYK